MNDLITLAKIAAVVEMYAGYSAEDYREVELAVHRGLERAKIGLIAKEKLDPDANTDNPTQK